MTERKKCDVTYGQTDGQTDGRTDGQTDDGEVIPKWHICLQQVTQQLTRHIWIVDNYVQLSADKLEKWCFFKVVECVCKCITYILQK